MSWSKNVCSWRLARARSAVLPALGKCSAVVHERRSFQQGPSRGPSQGPWQAGWKADTVLAFVWNKFTFNGRGLELRGNARIRVSSPGRSRGREFNGALDGRYRDKMTRVCLEIRCRGHSTRVARPTHENLQILHYDDRMTSRFRPQMPCSP